MNFHRVVALLALGVMGSALALGQKQSADSPKGTLERAYAAHVERIRKELPPHSGLPCLLDLSRPDVGEGIASNRWERKINGTMLIDPITDPGVSSPPGPTSVSMTFDDYVGTIWPLPARNSDAVILAKPVACSVHLARNRRFVYSSYSLEVSEVLKGKRKSGIVEGKRITAAQLGGSVRFPSGHEGTFLEVHEGFLELGQQYLIFVWRPFASDRTYAIDEAYLTEGGLTFPIMPRSADVAKYAGMPSRDFQAKVKAAIAKNENTM